MTACTKLVLYQSWSLKTWAAYVGICYEIYVAFVAMKRWELAIEAGEGSKGQSF